MSELTTNDLEVATLGGGCFWCLDAVFRELIGVEEVMSGYAGGARANPSYEQVTSGATGHAEVVQLRFNPSVISYREVLELFFVIHDPTTLNRQAYDVGTQYRSVIFTHSDVQEKVARALVHDMTVEELWPDPIVTEIAPAVPFYDADSVHQDYYVRNPVQPYCLGVVAPKVAKARKRFAEKLRPR